MTTATSSKQPQKMADQPTNASYASDTSENTERRDYPSKTTPRIPLLQIPPLPPRLRSVQLIYLLAKWYRSTFFNMTILGLCNLSAPGIWGAMNSLGAGGQQSPELVNAANALTFCLMVVSCYFSSVIVKYIGIKGALVFGT